MKRILFAAALAALFAGTASADDKPAAPATPAPVVTAAPVEMAPATSTRRGLFSRLRDRRSGSTMTAPTMATPTVTAPAMPMPGTTPAPTPVPTPMPGKTTGSVTPAGGTAMTGDVVTASYSEPAQRRGLFGRMRTR